MKKSLHKDQRGLGHAVVIILIVVVIAAVGFAGWRVMHKNKAATVTVTNSSANSSCMQVYNDAKLCQFAAANADIGQIAYTAVDNSVDAQGNATKITIKNDGKGNIAVSSASGNQSYNTITIGSTIYIQNGNSWIKYTSNAPAITNPAKDLKAAFSSTTTPAAQRIKYKNLGTSACGNATCYKYQIIDPANAGTTTYVWINTSNSRLQRMTTSSAQGTNDFTITYGPVTITAPSPVTSASSALDPAQQAEQQAAQQAAQQAQQNQ